MTEKIESERAKLLEEKEITKAKNLFMANVSHEIRTPLNSIMGSIDYLSEIKLSRTSKEALDDMKQSSFNLLYLVNDILDISGLESDKMDIHLSTERISTIIQSAYLVTKSGKMDNVKFSEYIDPDVPKCVVTDPQRVKQILINLLSNAFKFTDSGFVKLKISIATEKDVYELDLCPLDRVSMTPPGTPGKTVSDASTGLVLDNSDMLNIAKTHYSYRKGAIDPTKKGNKLYIKFAVSDSGIGIKQKNLNKLFKSFSQIDSSVTKKYGGTGLGLAISSGFCKLLQGGISLHSEWKKGTTFFFVIPVQLYSEENVEEVDTTILYNKKVLVVDDKVTNLSRLTRILDKYEVDYVTCQSPKHAISTYISNPRYRFDFGMLDVYMPEMDGNELAEYITKTESPFPLIALSSIDSKTTEISSYFDMLLQKPYNEEQLIKAMCTIIKTTEISKKINKQKRATSTRRSITIKKDKSKRKITRSVSAHAKRSSVTFNNKSIDSMPLNDNVKINILIVEDNIFNQKTIKRTLNSLGYYDLKIVDCGKHAIKAVKKNNGKSIATKNKKFVEKSVYDIILMDIIMPEMSGKTATKKIYKLFADKTLCPKIYAVTANVMPGDKEECLDLMDGYIEKPVNKDVLRNVLANL